MISFGKPTLDWFGFQSTRTKIYLRRHDLRFNTVVPDDQREELFATTIQPCQFEGNPNQTTQENVLVRVPRSAEKGAWWFEQSKTTPEGLQVVEGPLVRLQRDPTKAFVQVLVSEMTSCETIRPFAKLRPMTEDDCDLLEMTQELEKRSRTHLRKRAFVKRKIWNNWRLKRN